MSLPPNFSQAVDLSSLGKPAPDTSIAMPGIVVTTENLQSEILPLSNTKPVVIICWSNRSAESVTVLRSLANLEAADNGKWALATVDIDTQAPVAQALQARTIPYGVVFIASQAIPFLEQALTETQLREVMNKILTIAAKQGIGEEPAESSEPEEDEALAALDKEIMKAPKRHTRNYLLVNRTIILQSSDLRKCNYFFAPKALMLIK